MPSLEMNIPHQLDKEEALKRIRTLLEKVESRFPGQVQELKQDWKGNTGDFSFKVMNMPVSGTLTVDNGNVSLDSKIPLAASMFQGKIKSVILEEARKVLS
jgi:hypothetical protein